MNKNYPFKFAETIKINGQEMTSKYIETLSKEQRIELIEPIFNVMRQTEFIYPDNEDKIKNSWKKLLEFKPDLSAADLFNNSSLATDICQYFCRDFYRATEKDSPTMIDVFNDDKKLKRIIENRLGLDWLDADVNKDGTINPGVNEAFNLSFKMIAFQGARSMRMVNATSMFKPNIAKYMAYKYSEPGDLVGDYSCGFGGRMLGAVSAGRKYIGTDPLTTPDLGRMASYFKLKDYRLINSGSENYIGEKDSVDLYWSSPPYGTDTEIYDQNDETQAYFYGEEHFYNVYWKNTLENVRFMLKPGKWFGLNVKNAPKMLEMAEELFGPVAEQVSLRTIRSHLTKAKLEAEKMEYIYMFKNNK